MPVGNMAALNSRRRQTPLPRDFAEAEWTVSTARTAALPAHKMRVLGGDL